MCVVALNLNMFSSCTHTLNTLCFLQNKYCWVPRFRDQWVNSLWLEEEEHMPTSVRHDFLAHLAIFFWYIWKNKNECLCSNRCLSKTLLWSKISALHHEFNGLSSSNVSEGLYSNNCNHTPPKDLDSNFCGWLVLQWIQEGWSWFYYVKF